MRTNTEVDDGKTTTRTDEKTSREKTKKLQGDAIFYWTGQFIYLDKHEEYFGSEKKILYKGILPSKLVTSRIAN